MKIIYLLLFVTLTGCNNNNQKSTSAGGNELAETGNGEASAFVKSLEAIHNKSSWEEKRAVSFNIKLSINGEERLNAKVTSLTNSSKLRLDKNDGTKIVFDGEQVFLCPTDAEEKNSRFDIFAWQYFFTLPFKLSDPGTKIEMLEQQKIRGNILKRAKLSFAKDTGDSPDDWYLLYQESDTGLLHAASYIVTFNRNKEDAEENPHAIIYQNYIVVEGIPVSTRWTFHKWNEQEGFGEQIGEAIISNITFFNAQNELFEQPENSRLIN